MESLKDFVKSKGANLVGYADLRDLPPEIRHNLPYGISVAVALDPEIVATLDDGPTLEYEAEYNALNQKLDELTESIVEHLERKGHDAFSAPSTMRILNQTLTTPLPHKTVAVKAGLGWIGKSALLITPEYGSAIRLSTVLTDMELLSEQEEMGDRCGDCNICVAACPGGAPSGTAFEKGMTRDDFFSAYKCRDVTHKWKDERDLEHNICGICVNVCPWSQKYLHREGLKLL